MCLLVDKERGRLIYEIDSRMKTNDTEFTAEEIVRYKDAVKQTEDDILRQADIILCTCSTSVTKKIQQTTNIYQASKTSLPKSVTVSFLSLS